MYRFEFDKTFLKSGIYIIKCIQTKKYYVGSAGSVYNRLQKHKRLLEKSRHHNKGLQADYNAGYDFQISIIQEFNNQEQPDLIIAIEYLYMIDLLEKGLYLYNSESIPHKDQDAKQYFINCILGRLRRLYDIEFNTYYFKYLESKKED